MQYASGGPISFFTKRNGGKKRTKENRRVFFGIFPERFQICGFLPGGATRSSVTRLPLMTEKKIGETERRGQRFLQGAHEKAAESIFSYATYDFFLTLQEKIQQTSI